MSLGNVFCGRYFGLCCDRVFALLTKDLVSLSDAFVFCPENDRVSCVYPSRRASLALLLGVGHHLGRLCICSGSTGSDLGIRGLRPLFIQWLS